MSSTTPAARDLERALPAVYGELRQLAGQQLARERRDHTLQATALAHEAFLRMARQRRLDIDDRVGFLVAAARCMRRVLIDHARRRQRAKRGGPHASRVQRPSIDLATPGLQSAVDVADLVDRLAQLDPLQARIVELRAFGGLTFAEIARVVHMSTGAVHGEWRMARAWLLAHLEPSR